MSFSGNFRNLHTVTFHQNDLCFQNGQLSVEIKTFFDVFFENFVPSRSKIKRWKLNIYKQRKKTPLKNSNPNSSQGDKKFHFCFILKYLPSSQAVAFFLISVPILLHRSKLFQFQPQSIILFVFRLCEHTYMCYENSISRLHSNKCI